VKVGGVGGARASDTSGWVLDCLDAHPVAWRSDWWGGLVPMVGGIRNYCPKDLTGSVRVDAPLRAAKTPSAHELANFQCLSTELMHPEFHQPCPTRRDQQLPGTSSFMVLPVTKFN